MKFRKGTKVSTSGYKGIVTDVRNKQQRYVRLNSGMKVVDVSDLQYWKKKK